MQAQTLRTVKLTNGSQIQIINMIKRRESHFMRVITLLVVMCALDRRGRPGGSHRTGSRPRQDPAKVENGILGVANSFTRFRGTARECVGACFYANTTKTRVWTWQFPIAILIPQEVTRLAGAEFHDRTRKSFQIIQESNYTGAISGGESVERC